MSRSSNRSSRRESPALPATYTVQLSSSARDCLWRIAGYPFVYNNPWKWKVLWEANRDILIDPNNPDLIEVGQVLTIPSIAGEYREGDLRLPAGATRSSAHSSTSRAAARSNSGPPPVP